MTNVSTLSCCEIRSGIELRVIGEAYDVTPYLLQSARSAVYNTNNSRPKTNTCETEDVTCLMEDEAPA